MGHLFNRNKAKFAVTGAISILSLVTLIGIEHNFANISAQTGMANNTLFVMGSASNQTKPDKVTVSLGVETIDDTAQGALTSNSDLMNKVLEALKAAGVEEDELSTSTFSITPNYNYSTDNTQGKLTGFTVSNFIQIESSNIERVASWIDAAVSAGANNVNNIYFSLSNKRLDDMKNSLLKVAIDNTKTKADIAANAIGLRVIGVKSIIVGEAGLPPPVTVYNTEALKPGGGATSTPIKSGQQEISATVSTVYLIG